MALHRRVLIGTRFPVVTAVIIGGCLVGFIIELLQGKAISDFLQVWGLVPTQLAAYFKQVPGTSFSRSLLPFFTSLFLHGGFLHLAVNLAFLWIVGDVVEDVLGRVRFVVLFLFGAAAEVIVRMGVQPGLSGYASVGISGAVASLIGGYIVVMIWLSRAADEEQKADAASGGLSPASFAAAVPLSSRLSLLLGGLCWFPLQLLNRYASLTATCQTAEPVPWVALSACFFLGAFLVSLSGPRHSGTPTPSEAIAFPNEETAPIQA